MYDLGDVVALSVNVKDSTGTLANATAVACTITLPDATTSTPSVTNSSTGVYTISYTPTVVGRHTVRWVATGTNASAYTDAFTVQDSALLSLISLSEFKSHLNSTSTTNDEELRECLDTATSAAENLTGRVLARRSITETYDGGESVLRLRTPCALSVTSVTENGTTLASTGYRLRHGVVLERIVNSQTFDWYVGTDTVSVVYVAGVSGRDLAVAQGGVRAIAKHLWDTQRGAMTIGPRDDDFIVPGYGWAIPNRAAQLLEPISLLGNG